MCVPTGSVPRKIVQYRHHQVLSLFSGNPIAVLGHDFQTALQRRIAYRFKSSDDRYQIRGMTITHAVAYQCLQESRLSRSGVVDNTSMHLIQTPWTHVLLSTGDSPVVQVLEFALLMLVDRRTASVLMRDSGLGDLMSLVSTKADTAMMTFKAFKTAATPLLKPHLLRGGRLPNSAAHHFALEWWDHLTVQELVRSENRFKILLYLIKPDI